MPDPPQRDTWHAVSQFILQVVHEAMHKAAETAVAEPTGHPQVTQR